MKLLHHNLLAVDDIQPPAWRLHPLPVEVEDIVILSYFTFIDTQSVADACILVVVEDGDSTGGTALYRQVCLKGMDRTRVAEERAARQMVYITILNILIADVQRIDIGNRLLLDLTYLTFIHAKTGAVQLFAKTVTCAMTVIPSYHRSMVKILDSTLHFPFNSECRVPEKRTVVRCIIYEVVGNFPLCANAQVRGDIIP